MNYTILIECTDAKGLINGITGIIQQHNGNIISNHEFVDHERNRFFMRTEIEGAALDLIAMRGSLEGLLGTGASVYISQNQKKNIVILATREHHCLAELLVQHLFGELHANILAVISNHNNLQAFTETFNLPFHYITHEGITKEEHEKTVLALLESYKPDYIILAKYMRILSTAFTSTFSNRIVNIHHSFLPAFVGANPYRQAYERGVKIIGATAHFVNDQLDEGPIIVQQVIPTDHSLTVQDMAQMGRNIEKSTLAKALKYVFEDRVFVSGNKTIIFD